MANRGMGLLGAVCLLAAVSTFAQAQQTAIPTANNASTVVPRLIRFSGTLLDERGGAMKGPVGVTFALYTEQSGGAALWMETQNVDPDSNGDYTVLLAAVSANGLPKELFVSGDARWLGVQVEGRAEQPRILLVSVPYALKAADAETLGGLPPSAFASARSSPAESSSTASSGSSVAPVAAASTGSLNTSTDPNVTTPGGTVNFIPKFDTPSDVKTSQIFDNGTNVGIGFPVTPAPVPVAKLDINGSANVRGTLQLPAIGTANSTTKGFNSRPFDYLASVFNGTAAVNQHFRWEAEPVNPGLSTASGKLNLLFASGTVTPVETGLSISSKGQITFASGQTFPTVTGNETVTGNLSASELISTVANGTAPLKVTSTTQVPNLNASLLGGFAAGAFARLAAANTFTQPQSIKTAASGNLLSVQGTRAGAGSFTVDAFGNITNSGVIVAGNDINTFGFMFSNGLDSTGLATLENGLGVTGTTIFNGPVGIGRAPGSVAAPLQVQGGLAAAVLTGQTPSSAAVLIVENNSTVSDALIATFNSSAPGVAQKCTIDNSGNLACTGKKSAVVPTIDGRLVALYAVEAPENWFEDYGSARLLNGVATVTLDATYAQTVNTELEYHVFLTPNGDCNGLYVGNKSLTSFEVRELQGGHSNIMFDYRIIAKRKGYEEVRLEDKTAMMKAPEANAARFERKPVVPPQPGARATRQQIVAP